MIPLIARAMIRASMRRNEKLRARARLD